MPGQNSQSKLDPAQTQQMIRFAVRKPWENANSITQQGVRAVGLSPQVNPNLVSSQKSKNHEHGLIHSESF